MRATPAFFVAAAAVALSGACSDSSRPPVAVGDDAGADDVGSDAGPDADAGAPGAGIAFTDVASAVGLPAKGGMCMVFDDLDGDGRPDLLLDGFFENNAEGMQLFINQGGGQFKVQGFQWQPSGGNAPGSCSAGDFDGDGKLDIAIAIFSKLTVLLFHNKGGAVFEPMAELDSQPPQGVTDQLGFSALAIADFDLDGKLDVLAAPFLLPPLPSMQTCKQTPDGFSCFVPSTRCTSPPVVFPNQGQGNFGSPVSVVDASACGPANSNAVGVTDWNGDGRPDVFVANDWGIDAFYEQTQTPFRFTDVAPTLATKRYNHGMGVAFADYDADGTLDYYVADLGSDQLYLGAGGGQVAAHAGDWGVAVDTQFHSGWAPLAEDFDNDSWLDVWVANSALVRDFDDLKTVALSGQLAPVAQSDFVLHNAGGAKFDLVQVMQTANAEPVVVFGRTALADYDGDGRTDVVEGVGYPPRLQLMHNEGARAHWVDVRLQGTTSNRDGIGAVVTLKQSGRPAQQRMVTRTRGSVGASWAVAHFGLGDRAPNGSVDSIDVAWPSGKKQTASAPKVDGTVEVVEP